MTFDYNVYFRQNCVVPVAFLLVTIFVVSSQIARWWNNNGASTNVTRLTRALAVCIFVFLFIVNMIPLIRGGAYLLIEKESDVIQVQGTIEDTIELGSIGGAKYQVEQNHGYGEAIVIDGSKYYLMTYGDYRIGDNVVIDVLPRSSLVLRIDYAN